MKKFISVILIILFAVALLLGGCKKKQTEPAKPAPEPTKTTQPAPTK